MSGLLLFAGCNAARAPLLGGPPDLERTAPPDPPDAAGVAAGCAAGRPWVATVRQVEFDARLELIDGAGRVRAAVAGPAGAAGEELLYQDGDAPQPLRLRVVAVQPPPPAARYRLRVHCLAPQLDAAVAQALRATTAAGDPARATDPQRRDAAVAQYRDAESAWLRLGETRLAAEAALQQAGLHYFEREDWAPAIEAARRVSGSAAAADEPLLRHAARLLEGAAALELARGGRAAGADAGSGATSTADPWAGALAALRDARDGYARAGAPVAAAQVEVYRGALHYDRGEFDAAVAAFEGAAAAFRAAGASADEARVARNLAAVRFDRGDYAGAARAYESLLPRLTPTAGPERAAALQNLAAAYSAIGETERALSAYRESLELGTRLGSDDTIARALAGLGVNHARLGHTDLALTYLRDAVALRRRQDRPDALAQVLAQLGDVLHQRGEHAAASAAHREAVVSIGPGAAPALRARMQLALGTDQAAAGEHARAVDTFSAALALLQASEHGLVARVLVERAASRRALRAWPAAAADAAQATELARRGDNRETLIAARLENARIALARGDRGTARREADAAIGEIERLPAGAANPDNRLTLRARLRAVYDLRIGLLAEDALQARRRGEAAAARGLALEALRAAAADLAGPVSGAVRRARRPDDGAAAATEELYARLAARRHRLEALAERNVRPTPTMLALEREVALLRTQLATGDAADAKVRAPSRGPAPAPASTPAPASASASAPAATPSATPATPPRPAADTAVIAYWLGESRSWRWTLTAGGLELEALPPRAEIEAGIARLLRRVRAPLADAAATGRELDAVARLLLPSPASLAAARRWRIVSDGAIGGLPWPLLARRAAVDSVSLLASGAALFEPAPARPAASRAEALRLALFGDPVFGPDDPRLATAAPRPAPLAEPDPRPLSRLPGTARELEVLAGLDGAEVRLQATGVEANRAALLALPASGLDVLHLATHALIDPDVPELAALVLSRVDARGAPQSGSVRAADILRLGASPPLVVLSACDAAADPAGASEGRMNLVRAFLASGAREVVASLWEVPDASTIELMTQFYDGLLRERLDPEAALVRAQGRLAASGRWRAPYYWAGFVLTRGAP